MKVDKKRKSGFYWVRFEGKVLVAEYTTDGYPAWYIPHSSEPWYYDYEICELLSDRLPEPTSVPSPSPVRTQARQKPNKQKKK